MRNPRNIIKRYSRKGPPSVTEGNDGDISINVTRSGIGLFGKVKNTWYRFGNAQEASRSGKSTKKKKLLKQDLSIKDLDVDRTINIGKTAITINPNRVFTVGNTDTDFLNISSRVFDVSTSSTVSKLYIGDISLQQSWGGTSIEMPGADNNSAKHIKIIGGNSTAGSNAGGNIYINPGASAGGNAGALHLGQNSAASVTSYLTTVYGTSIVLDASGDISLSADGDQITMDDGTATIFTFDVGSCRLTISDDDNTNDFFRILVGAEGATNIVTYDADTEVAHLSLIPDGNLILQPAGGKILIDATDRLYFDGGTDTYIDESAGDRLDITVGADVLLRLYENGTSGNAVDFKTSCAGFTQLEPTYNASDTDVDFRHSNKQFVTFGSGNIADMNLFFPYVSGNFVLLLKQDGTGSRTVASDGWLAFDKDGNAANGSSTVKWAGGVTPTLTTDANHVDILSFYWDADNEIAYGVPTLDFQF